MASIATCVQPRCESQSRSVKSPRVVERLDLLRDSTVFHYAGAGDDRVFVHVEAGAPLVQDFHTVDLLSGSAGVEPTVAKSIIRALGLLTARGYTLGCSSGSGSDYAAGFAHQIVADLGASRRDADYAPSILHPRFHSLRVAAGHGRATLTQGALF